VYNASARADRRHEEINRIAIIKNTSVLAFVVGMCENDIFSIHNVVKLGRGVRERSDRIVADQVVDLG